MVECHLLEETQSEKQSAFETAQDVVLKICVQRKQRLKAVCPPVRTVTKSHDLSPLVCCGSP